MTFECTARCACFRNPTYDASIRGCLLMTSKLITFKAEGAAHASTSIGSVTASLLLMLSTERHQPLTGSTIPCLAMACVLLFAAC